LRPKLKKPSATLVLRLNQETVATGFETKPDKIVATGFEAKPKKNYRHQS
jgi:hypothetical protein